MEYLLRSIVDNIKKYSAHYNNLVYENITNELIFNGELILPKSNGFFFFKNFLCLHNEARKTILIDLKSSQVKTLNTIFNQESFFQGTFLSTSNYIKNLEGKWESDLFLNNFDPNYVIKKYPYKLENGGIRWGNNLLQTSNNIKFRFLDTNEIIWQFPLSKFGTYTLAGDEKEYKVLKIIGEYNGSLIIQLTNSLLLILDIQSGKQIKVLDLNEYISFPSGVVFNDYIPMHLADDKLIWLSNQVLLNIDIVTYEVTIIKEYFQEARANQFRFMSNNYYKDHIYFVADYGWQYVTASNVGVMDAKTGEVLWYQQLEKTGGLAEAPQVSEDKLYIRTNNNVLHIFQKEEKAS